MRFWVVFGAVCGNFHFNLRYCGYTTLSGLRLLQTLSCGIRWKKNVFGDKTLLGFHWVLSHPIVLLEAQAKCFVLRHISLQINPVVNNCLIFHLKLDVINRYVQWHADLVTFWARYRLGISVDLFYLPSLVSWIYLPWMRARQRQGKIKKWRLTRWRLSISFICICGFGFLVQFSAVCSLLRSRRLGSSRNAPSPFACEGD